MIDLEPNHMNFRRGIIARASKSKPFVVNKCGKLVHRPRMVTLYDIHRHQHMSISYWCGASHVGDYNKFEFVDDTDGVVCNSCETAAIRNNLPSSAELAGHHMHVGGVELVRFCCKWNTDEK